MMKKMILIMMIMIGISGCAASVPKYKTYSNKDPEYLLWCSGEVIVFVDRKGMQHICE